MFWRVTEGKRGNTMTLCRHQKFSKILLMAIIASGLLSLAVIGPVLAQQTESGLIRDLKIRQEIKKEEGVLMSRPQEIDLKILEIIRVNKIHSFEDYSRWLEDNIRYRKDQRWDIWSNPKATLQKRSGDCEDYAFLTVAVARLLGYEPRFIAFVRNKFAHAVCAFKRDGYYVWFDNARFITTQARTLEEFGDYITQEYKYNELHELDFTSREWRPVYKRT